MDSSFYKETTLICSNLGNPLLRSGLALADVNTWLKGNVLSPEAEDGILISIAILHRYVYYFS